MIRNHLANLLQSEHLTVTEVANSIGISRVYLGLIVSEQKVPSMAVAFRIAKYFHMSLNGIFYDDGIPSHERDVGRTSGGNGHSRPLLSPAPEGAHYES